jgi:hypothetical protein
MPARQDVDAGPYVCQRSAAAEEMAAAAADAAIKCRGKTCIIRLPLAARAASQAGLAQNS